MSKESFTVIGTPCSGPTASPRAIAASARSASPSAASKRVATTAFSAGFTRSMRAMHAATSSRDEMRFARIAARHRGRADGADVHAQPPATKLRSSSEPSAKCAVHAPEAVAAATSSGRARARAGAPHLLPEASRPRRARSAPSRPGSPSCSSLRRRARSPRRR